MKSLEECRDEFYSKKGDFAKISYLIELKRVREVRLYMKSDQTSFVVAGSKVVKFVLDYNYEKDNEVKELLNNVFRPLTKKKSLYEKHVSSIKYDRTWLTIHDIETALEHRYYTYR